MWARAVKAMLGTWLMISPFIFPRPPHSEMAVWATELAGGALVITLSLLSCWKRASWTVFLLLIPVVWMFGFGYFGFSHPRPPAAQNFISVAILLLMFLIIPRSATAPPERGGQREFLANVHPLRPHRRS